MIAIEIPKVTYVTGADARMGAYYLDLPYGSHYSNAPFQRKNGPAFALIAAGATISSGAALGGFIGGMLIVGGIASGLGAITGNQTLSTIGMGLSLAGGIGSAFTDVAGNFVNPFAEGSSFGDTALGAGIAKMKSGVSNFFSDVTGSAPDAVTQAAQTGNEIVTNAGDVGTAASPSIDSGTIVRDINNNVVSGGTLAQRLNDATSSMSGSSGGGGLLNSGSSSALLKGVSGAADAYNNYQNRQQAQPLIDARVDQTNADTNLKNIEAGIVQQRQANMQAQPKVGLGVNPNAQVFGNAPATGEGKVAVVLDGQVKYLSQAEYVALQNQKNAQTPPGTGLLATGAAQ